MKCAHWTKPSTIKTAAMTGYDHEQGDQSKDCKADLRTKIAANNNQGQQGDHEVLADVSTTGFFNF